MLFDDDIDPCCTYCHYGTDLGCGEVACIKYGIMNASGSCGAFRYEPTKRQPQVEPPLYAAGLSEQEFSLFSFDD